MHFELVALAYLIFIACGFIGSGIADGLGRHYPATRRWLLSPVAGVSSMVLLTALLSKIGFATKHFGPFLVGAALAANVVYWLIKRPAIDWKKAALWNGALFVALLLVGWPLVLAGYNWVSFGNIDMTTYLLGANHFYEYSFYQLPSLDDLLREVDPSWDYSFYYSIGEVRSASQLILALVMSVTSLTAVQCYMLLILAFHLTVIATAAALICSRQTRERIALVALLVIGSSANLALGTFNQLLPQDLGISALTASSVVLLNRPPSGSALYLQSGLGGIFLGTLLVAYPEMLPFALIPFLIYIVITLVKRAAQARQWLRFVGLTGAWALICANAALPGALHLLIWTFGSSTSFADVGTLFPYYMTPFGLALGWGLAPMGISDAAASTWQMQMRILLGGGLFLNALVPTQRDALRLEAAAVVAATMLLLFIELFFGKSAFGLFKLAMYAQPFVLGALTIAVARMLGARPALESAGAEG